MHGIKKLSNVSSSNFRNRLAKFPPSAGFPSPSGGVAPSAPPLGHLRRPFGRPPPSAAVKEKKKNWGAMGAPVGASAYAAFGDEKIKNSGAYGASNGFKNVTRSLRIPNMCLVLKLDNGKVVSIANGQNHRWTESPNHPVPY